MKNDLRIAVTRRMIKEGLLHLLEEKELDKVKINELCEAAGVNRATFYRHYNTPQDVLHEIEMDFVRQTPKPARPPQTMEEAQKNIEAVCQFFFDHSDLTKLLFRNKTDEDMMKGMEQFYQKFLELHRKEERFAHIDDDTIKILIALLGGGCQHLLRKWILEDIPKTPQEIAAIMCNVIRWPVPEGFSLFDKK